ncbi:MAG: DUF2029 domain-containing protein [Chloroflexi bacterium]|nr:MAG: DUF2029 domain-containing protein [Chloroflexota bacterium]
MGSEPVSGMVVLKRLIIAAVWLGASVIAAKLAVHHMVTMPSGKHWNDSYIYLGAASNFIDHPSHLYDAAHLQVVRSWAQRAFVHPPSGLLPYLPFVPLVRIAGMPVAASVWTVIDTVALLGGVVVFGRRVGLGWLTLGAAALVVSLSAPTQWEVDSGQITGLVLLLLALSLLRMPKADAGVLMGLALAIKPVSAIVLLVPLLRGRAGVTVVAVLTLAVLNAAFIPLIGLGAALFYAGSVLPFFASYTLHNPGNIALPNVLQRWLGGGLLPAHRLFRVSVPQTLDALILLWGVRIAVALLWIRSSIDRKLDVAVAVAVAMATVPILSSTIWPHYLIYLLPLALVTLASSLLWVRAGGALALIAMLWPGRGDGLWVAVALLWVSAAVLLVNEFGWIAPLRARDSQPRLRPGT